ncbi:MAG: FAD-dependent oxidoreductase [Alphaproteobacteria bacterium]|nr:FAD-dependent oxidoreductase [Alphaproteobacteria bacterium]MCW5743459.1 FAD-dependent oxidoreductase [Alphaproteobacteria bacterium]
MIQSSPSIAVVGAGPSGFYAVDALSRARPDARIDIIDRLPAPFGLARYGVAPDHQGTKGVTRQFDRLLAKPGVRFVGGVELGRDVSLEELRGLYDAVLIATGCGRDRRLGIPGEDLEGVMGSMRFVDWFNAHPDAVDLTATIAEARHVAVIGNGNVAIDVARVFAKTQDEMAKSDIDPRAQASIAAMKLQTVTLYGRRGPAEASFTINELNEMGRLARAVALVDPGDVADAVAPDSDPTPERLRKQKNIESLRGFSANVAGARPVALAFRFHRAPLALSGENGRVVGINFADGSYAPADLVITCIGYDAILCEGLPAERGRVANEEGRVRGLPGVYVVGWARRGPSGTIPTNRADSFAVAERLVGDLAPSSRPGPAGLDALLASRGIAIIDTAGWQRIDKAEGEAGAREGRPRVKLATWAALRAASRATCG